MGYMPIEDFAGRENVMLLSHACALAGVASITMKYLAAFDMVEAVIGGPEGLYITSASLINWLNTRPDELRDPPDSSHHDLETRRWVKSWYDAARRENQPYDQFAPPKELIEVLAVRYGIRYENKSTSEGGYPNG